MKIMVDFLEIPLILIFRVLRGIYNSKYKHKSNKNKILENFVQKVKIS